MPLPDAARDYLLKALAATPVVASSLIGDRAEEDPIWDRRPDPERFSLREVLAHLADWEPIWLERLTKIATTDHPFLPSVDETAMVEQNDYANSSPRRDLAKLREGRENLIAYLKTVPDEAWDRTGDREFVGILTLQQQAYFALSHDAYHLRQIAEWLA